jgi:hypothetical protein
MSNKSITLRELLKLLNEIPEEKLDYEVWSNSDGNYIANVIVQLNINDDYKTIELTTE